jgi:Zn-dependent alcohol dehydrogenase
VSLPGRARVFAGDHVIPLYTPECRSCAFCMVRRQGARDRDISADEGWME